MLRSHRAEDWIEFGGKYGARADRGQTQLTKQLQLMVEEGRQRKDFARIAVSKHRSLISIQYTDGLFFQLKQ